MNTASKFPKKAVIAVAVALAAALAWPALKPLLIGEANAQGKPEQKKADAKGVPVRTALVTRESLPVALAGIGTVQPAQSVTVRSRVDGQLDSVHFKEGEDVREGQLLVQLDDRMLAAAVQQAEAQRARDEAQLGNAETDMQRYTALLKDQASTQQQVDLQRALVRQLQATVRSDAATLNAARVQLSFTRITAPISGRVGARLVDAGNIVHVTDPAGLVVINQIDPIAVQFALPEGNFQSINKALREAGKHKLAVQALDRDSHAVLADGELTLLNNQIDTSTGTVQLKGMFKNRDHKLWPGQQVDVRLVLGVQADALSVPAAAVQRSQDGLFVYVVGEENKVRVQSVSMREVDANRVQVTEGLKAGDRVVTDGQYRLTPGARAQEVANKPKAGDMPASGASK
ncbi:MAG: efflux RND transporter periplasmic adaptor subunit [Paucibacter sp.]|nr:efflux RND transporter periplasmic adaptor subunit [Roseateles sp.]